VSKLRLSNADQQRLGTPEFLPFGADSLTNREAIELRKFGYNTPRMFWNALKAREVKEDGEVVDLEMDYLAWTAFVWLALRRAGVETDPATLEFDLDGLRFIGDDEEPEPVDEEPGKAPDPDPSTNSETTS
jgi:hypothetical protein